MDLTKIKQFVKQSNTHKFIVVENGEPEMVIMSFAEYERLTRQEDMDYETTPPAPQKAFSYAPRTVSPDRPFPQTVRDEESAHPPIRSTETAGLPVHLEDIRLEDLPV